jgi:hypothetical protein
MTRDVAIVLAILNTMAVIGRAVGDVVVLAVFLFYSLAACFVLAGLSILIVIFARWWTKVPFRTRRACWAMGLICWSLRTLCSREERLDIAQWMDEWVKMEISRLTPPRS